MKISFAYSASTLTALLVFGVPAAIAQSAGDYPNRPIRMIVPFPAGGSADTLARITGQKLTESWGQQVVVDNRSGAGGNIGEKWLRSFEQISPIYKWNSGRLVTVQSCPRRRASLATNATPRWATRGAPKYSSYAASLCLGKVATYFSCGVSRSSFECGRCVLYQSK